MASVLSSPNDLASSAGHSGSSPDLKKVARSLNFGRDLSPIRGNGFTRANRSSSRDWSPCRRAIDRAGGLGWSPQRRSSTPTRPTVSRGLSPVRCSSVNVSPIGSPRGKTGITGEWSPIRRASSTGNLSPFRSPRSKAEAFASLKRTPDQMVKQADRLIERTQAILDRSAEAKKRTEERLKASRERRSQERLQELTGGRGEPLALLRNQGSELNNNNKDDHYLTLPNGHHVNGHHGDRQTSVHPDGFETVASSPD